VSKIGPTQTPLVGSTHLEQVVGDTVATRLLAKPYALQHREGFTEDVYLFSHFKLWYFDNHFYLAHFKAIFMTVLILVKVSR
jgi:hypothetical protein